MTRALRRGHLRLIRVDGEHVSQVLRLVAARPRFLHSDAGRPGLGRERTAPELSPLGAHGRTTTPLASHRTLNRGQDVAFEPGPVGSGNLLKDLIQRIGTHRSPPSGALFKPAHRLAA